MNMENIGPVRSLPLLLIETDHDGYDYESGEKQGQRLISIPSRVKRIRKKQFGSSKYSSL